ncbi:uncharacterized protein METZ01_LOCUS409635, partial [marine metagenome]
SYIQKGLAPPLMGCQPLPREPF